MARRFDALALVAIVVATALPALLFSPLPTQDGPQHAFTAYAFARLGDPGLRFGEYLNPHFPLSSQGWVFLVIGLDTVMPFEMAERVSSALMLALFPLCGAVYARMTGRAALPIAAMLALTAYGWILAMGFYNFLLGLALVPLAVGWVEKRLAPRSPPQDPHTPPTPHPTLAGLAPMMLALAWFHLVAAVLAGALMLLVALAREEGRLTSAARVVGFSLPAAGYAVWSGTRHLATNVNVGFVTEVEPVFLPWGERFEGLIGAGPGGLSLPTGAILGGACLLVALMTLARPSVPRVRRLFVLFGLALTAAYLLAPLHAARWAFLSPRFLFGATFVFALAAVPPRRSPRWTAAAVLLALAGLAGATGALSRLHAEIEPVGLAIDRMPHAAGNTLLSLEFADHSEGATDPEPTLHLPVRALIGRGGVTPYLFAFNAAVHSVVFREDPVTMVGPAPGSYVRRGFRCGDLAPVACMSHLVGLSDRIAWYGLRWVELVTLHTPVLLEARLRERGYRLLFDEDEVQLWLARPSALQVELALPREPLPGTLVVRVGYIGATGWVDGVAMPPGTVPPEELDVTFEPLLVGPVDLEVFLDSNGDGEPTDGEWVWRPDVSLRHGHTTVMRHGRRTW
jgi:hypothetical protein